MEKNKTDFSELDEELDEILYNDGYKPIRELWKTLTKYNLDFVWRWFLWDYNKIYDGGVFDSKWKMKTEAEKEYNEWIKNKMEKIKKILNG
jgi:hypothetical protein